MAQYSITVGPSHTAAREAKHAGLYERGGLLKDTLAYIAKERNHNNTVALLHDHSLIERHNRRRAMGVAIILPNGHCMAYVRPELRRQGWGRKLMQAAKAATMVSEHMLFSRPGDDLRGSGAFWHHVDIVCRELEDPLRLTAVERQAFQESNCCLVFRPVDRLPRMVIERLYLDRLYTDDYSDEHDGIRGHLATIIGEDWSPVDFILFHLTFLKGHQEFLSAGTVCTAGAEGTDAPSRVAKIQLFVRESHRGKGLGQEMIDRIRAELPSHALQGYHTPSSKNLYHRNAVENLRRDPA